MENNLLNLENIVEEIKEKESEKVRLEELFNAKVEELNNALKDKTNKIENEINYLKQMARVQFESQPYKETKTQKKISLLSGDVVLKKATKKIEGDKNILLDWGKTNASEYIEQKIVESFRWADFKKNLQITDDGQVVNTETGELVTEGITVVDVPEEVIIK